MRGRLGIGTEGVVHSHKDSSVYPEALAGTRPVAAPSAGTGRWLSSVRGVRRTPSGSRRSRTRPAVPAARHKAAAAGQSASGGLWTTHAPSAGAATRPLDQDVV